MDGLARVTFAVESPIRRLVGYGRLNPLPHAGTISVVLLIIVTITGLYLTFFFEFGFDASYESVARLNGHPIQRFMRGVHRYSSAALVLTTLVHGWRILTARRYQGPRRWRWVTGVAAIGLTFLAGVTGYWLIWDQRAQLLNELTVAFFDFIRIGRGVVTAILTARGTGWQVLLSLWAVHFLLTLVIGWFLWRHLRRTRLPWLPPRLWTGMMTGALVLVAIVVPVEMLGPADLAVIVSDVPIDPFFLFLIPILATASVALVMVVGLVVLFLVFVLPWVLRRGEDEVVEIIVEACTGCELCVIDCPYEALAMVTFDDRQVAEVDPARCVACGICVGSCAFGAIELADATLPPDVDVEGRRVVVACDRHGRLSGAKGQEVLTVRCTGVLAPTAVTGLFAAGAMAVQIVGCAPGDCAFGVGNTLAEERLAGERRPRVPRKTATATQRDFVAPTALRKAIASPGSHLSANTRSIPASRARLAAAAVLVLASIVLVGVATTLTFSATRAESAVVVVVHHVPGASLAGTQTPSGAPGVPSEVRIEFDDEVRVEQVGSGGLASAVIALEASPGSHKLEVELIEGTDRTVISSGQVVLDPDMRYAIYIQDAEEVGAAVGEDLFFSSHTGCSICHSTEPGVELVGPNLSGVAITAGSRVPDLGAEEYLRQSIVDPDAYIVDGFRSGQMLPIYEERLTEEEIDSLVEFLLTLDDPEGVIG